MCLFILMKGVTSRICSMDNNPDQLRIIKGPVVPGMTNVHSHAFQYAMAGLTEVRQIPLIHFGHGAK